MPGVSFDDQYPIHRKVAGLSDAGFRLHTSAVFWCFRNCTDGFIDAGDLALVCPQMRAPERVAAECVRRKVWHEAGQECPSADCPEPVDGDGWVIHDYLRWQPSKSEAQAEREGKSDGGSLGNHRRWHAGRGVVKPGCPYCRVASPSDNRSDMRSDNRSVPDRSPESGANPISLSLSVSDLSVVDLVSHVADRYAHALDDDDLLKTIIDSLHQRTSQVITADQARIVGASILAAARQKPGNLHAYLRSCIRNEPDPRARFLTAAAGPPPARPSWCGDCNEATRMCEKPDGTPYRCPNCHPLREAS